MESIYIILAFVTGWFIAQATKIVIALIRKKGKISAQEMFELIMKSGGMPRPTRHALSQHRLRLVLGLDFLRQFSPWQFV